MDKQITFYQFLYLLKGEPPPARPERSTVE